MTNSLTITALEGLPFVDFEREFDAPVEAVFRAHRQPELINQWLGPNGYEMHIDHYDFVSHGGYCYVHRNPAGDGRTRLRGHAVYPSLEARDGMVASGMERGMSEGYERLEELVAAQ